MKPLATKLFSLEFYSSTLILYICVDIFTRIRPINKFDFVVLIIIFGFFC